MNINCRVVIDRGSGAVEHFDGVVKAETSSHVLVTHAQNMTEGEWFARRSPGASPKVHVSIYGRR